MNDGIAICVPTHIGWYTSKDFRANEIFDYLIDSMNRCDGKDRLELSVVDCSAEVPEFAGRIRQAWQQKMVFRYDPEACRYPDAIGILWISYAFNCAVRQCQAGKIFLCGMDTILPKDFVEQFDRKVGEKTVWLPCSEYVMANGTKTNQWRTDAKGKIGLLKKDYLALGGQDEKYNMPKFLYSVKIPESKSYLKTGHDTCFLMKMRKARYKINVENYSSVTTLDHRRDEPNKCHRTIKYSWDAKFKD